MPAVPMARQPERMRREQADAGAAGRDEQNSLVRDKYNVLDELSMDVHTNDVWGDDDNNAHDSHRHGDVEDDCGGTTCVCDPSLAVHSNVMWGDDDSNAHDSHRTGDVEYDCCDTTLLHPPEPLNANDSHRHGDVQYECSGACAVLRRRADGPDAQPEQHGDDAQQQQPVETAEEANAVIPESECRNADTSMSGIDDHVRMSIRHFLNSRLVCSSSQDVIARVFAELDDVLSSKEHVAFAMKGLSEMGINCM